jgi:hypothetical protein
MGYLPCRGSALSTLSTRRTRSLLGSRGIDRSTPAAGLTAIGSPMDEGRGPRTPEVNGAERIVLIGVEVGVDVFDEFVSLPQGGVRDHIEVTVRHTMDTASACPLGSIRGR